MPYGSAPQTYTTPTGSYSGGGASSGPVQGQNTSMDPRISAILRAVSSPKKKKKNVVNEPGGVV